MRNTRQCLIVVLKLCVVVVVFSSNNHVFYRETVLFVLDRFIMVKKKENKRKNMSALEFACSVDISSRPHGDIFTA